MPEIILRIPDGSRVIRRATDAEAIEHGRMLLIRAPDGKVYWVNIDGGLERMPIKLVGDETAE
jgi:hypothetical protein